MNNLGTSIVSEMQVPPSMDQLASIQVISDMLSDTSLNKPTVVLTGYAGTGKTTLIAAMVSAFKACEMNFIILAPTGRAAKVASGYSGVNASTIHRHIYNTDDANPLRIKYKMASNPDFETVYIVDEASMITDSMRGSGSVLEDLAKYVFIGGRKNKLLLVGDPAQLPPVGQYQSNALDIDILSRKYGLNVASTSLTAVHRQKVDSGILHNATVIRNSLNGHKQLFLNTSYSDVFKLPESRLIDCLKYAYSKYDPLNTAVVTRSNKRATTLNALIRKYVLNFDREITKGEVLMTVKNNYSLFDDDDTFLANGDLVEVTQVHETKEKYGFRYQRATIKIQLMQTSRIVTTWLNLDGLQSESAGLTFEQNKLLNANMVAHYSRLYDDDEIMDMIRTDPFYNALQVKYAYAITCHKAQGGQYDCVVVDCPGGYNHDMDFLRWLYTAVTRSVKELYFLNFHLLNPFIKSAA